MHLVNMEFAASDQSYVTTGWLNSQRSNRWAISSTLRAAACTTNAELAGILSGRDGPTEFGNLDRRTATILSSAVLVELGGETSQVRSHRVRSWTHGDKLLGRDVPVIPLEPQNEIGGRQRVAPVVTLADIATDA
jgi:hypothetical protein